MPEIKEELLDAIHVLLKASRVLPKEDSLKEMILLLVAEIWGLLKISAFSIINYFKSLRLSRNRKISNIEQEHANRLNRIVGYKIFSKEALDIFDDKIDKMTSKYPKQDINAEVKEMKDSADEYLEYQKERNGMISSYLPVLSVALITLLFIYAYGLEFIFSKQGSLILALVTSLFICKNNFVLTYDIAVAKHVKILLERVERNI
jgi:hypothetical protein